MVNEYRIKCETSVDGINLKITKKNGCQNLDGN